MSLSEQLSSLKSHIAECENELKSLESGRKSSAPRLRKQLMNIKNKSHTMRGSTMEYLKGLPVKSKKETKVEPEPEVQEEQLPDPPKLEREQTIPKPKRVRKKKE